MVTETFRKFFYKFFRTFVRPVRKLPRKVVKLLKWFPIIWKDEDWDYHFIYEILKHKLRFTRECISKYGYHANKETVCKHIRMAEILIERIQKDEYTEAADKEHLLKWGPLEFRSVWGGTILGRAKVYSEEERKRENEESLRITKHGMYMRKQDETLLFELLRKRINTFWD